MKWTLLLISLIGATSLATAQDMKAFNLYHPQEDAAASLQKAVKEAKAANKHVLVQIGGNWCVWCARFHEFVTKDPQIDSLIRSAFVVYHLNYSKENKNSALLEKFGFPQRFGFPVFLVLDGTGNRLHTQNSGLLEEGKGYSKQKVIEFLEQWTPKALDPSQYKNF